MQNAVAIFSYRNDKELSDESQPLCMTKSP